MINFYYTLKSELSYDLPIIHDYMKHGGKYTAMSAIWITRTSRWKNKVFNNVNIQIDDLAIVLPIRPNI